MKSILSALYRSQLNLDETIVPSHTEYRPLNRKIASMRDQFMCQECKRYGKTSAATTVHHICPLEHYPEYAFTSWNLVSLCMSCHEKMHNRLTDQLTEIGAQWVIRASPPLSEQTKRVRGTGEGGGFQ